MKKTTKDAQLKIALLCVAIAGIGFGLGFIANNPKTIPTLSNGDEVVAKIDGKDFTANELYEKLKEDNLGDSLLTLIDDYIASSEIKDNTEAIEYAESSLETIKAQYKQSGGNFKEDLKNSIYQTEEKFIEMTAKDYLLTLAAEKYAKEKMMTEEEIKSYYESDIVGEMHVRYILVQPEVTDDMTAEQKSEAEAKALAEANDVITKLKNGEDFAELATKHSDDASTSSQGGLFDGFVKNDVVEEFWNAAVSLEDGKYTTTPVESVYGYFVILRINQDEKPKLEDVKEDILDALLTKKSSEEENYLAKVWVEMRKNYNLEIIDTELEKDYNDIVDYYTK